MVLQARNLTVSMQAAGGPIDVLRDVSFDLAPGKVLGLVGESGAGKSMIGRVISRNLPRQFSVTQGSLTFASRDMIHGSDAMLASLLGERIAFVPQEPLTALNSLMTIAEQFGEHLDRIAIPRAQQPAQMVKALEEVKLLDPARVLSSYPFQLSGGMCQRVLIAMAFVSQPALVVADEPTTALDVSTQATIVQIMRRLQQDHDTALLFITHDLRLAAHVCDDILVLYAGEVVEHGPARAISEHPQHPYTRALQAANPSLDGPLTRLPSLPDNMPGLAGFAALKGCRFGPRCPVADPACAGAVPHLHETSPGHWVRCSPACQHGKPPAAPLIEHAADQNNGAVILQARGLSKHFEAPRNWLGRHKGPGLHAVRPMDFTVRAGEFVGVVGESGSGKSTLARLLMGLETPSSGQISLDGRDLTHANPQTTQLRLDTLQMVFQDPQSALNPRRSVEELVTQVMESGIRAATSAERRQRAQDLLRETGLSPELIHHYPSQLSGGQKQRVNIARALCVTPRLLIADEIVSGLDVSVQAQILNLLLDLKAQRQIGLVFISHDLSVVRYLCSSMIVMRHGKVVEQGPTVQIFANPQHAYTRALLAAAPPADLDCVWPPEQTSQ
jgi:peptide/nickel transport system ATP-binding protein